MNLYQRYCLPHLIHYACSLPQLAELRYKLVPLAKGQVLEVGIGSGLNLPFYSVDQVQKLWGLEPSTELLGLAEKQIEKLQFPFEKLELPGERIPLLDNSVDTIVMTFTLCSIPDWLTALKQMRRVLKPDGRLLFCEHGLARQINIQRWQHRITPIWKKLAGGCHLDRPIALYLQEAGFEIVRLEEGFLDNSLKIAAYTYQGEAKLA